MISIYLLLDWALVSLYIGCEKFPGTISSP